MANTKLKIAMIAACPLPYPRGTPIRIYKMACALAEQGCEVHVIAYHLYDKLQQENESKAITIHRIPNVFGIEFGWTGEGDVATIVAPSG